MDNAFSQFFNKKLLKASVTGQLIDTSKIAKEESVAGPNEHPDVNQLIGNTYGEMFSGQRIGSI